MADRYTHRSLDEVEDSAPEFGLDSVQEARFANDAMETEQTGLSLHRIKPGKRQGFGHSHEEAEEVYVVLSGSGRIRLDDEVRDIGRLDAIRVEGKVMRAFEAGEDGLEVIAFGPKRSDDRGELEMNWWKD